jgi:integrase
LGLLFHTRLYVFVVVRYNPAILLGHELGQQEAVMPRQIHRLNARRVATETKVGRHADGGGLYLSISDNGGRRWVFLYRRSGKLREMGLGSARDVPLARARELAGDARQQIAAGRDPLSTRQKGQSSMTFKECAIALIAAKKAGWRNAKHASQWSNTLETYAYPVIGALPVDEIGVDHIMRILEPIWSTKTETATRVRSRIENVLDWARSRGYRAGENPARWRGHIANLLPARSKVRKVRHHPALPYDELPAFMGDLRKRTGPAARALEFTILTAARTGEAIGALWSEFSFDKKMWMVPAERMKAGKEHRVPLSVRAMTIVRHMRSRREDDSNFVFPGGLRGKGLSNMAMNALLDRMGRSGITVHGFRSSFRDWAAECTNFPNEMVELALAHLVDDKVEAAYRRGDMFERRLALMSAWASYCERGRTSATITPTALTRRR